MKSLDKDSFLLLLKLRPQWLIAKQIIYDGKTVGILDISMSGDYLHLEGTSTATEWVPASSLGDSVIIDNLPMDYRDGPFTVLSITRQIESLENRVGQPGSEPSKSLFEIVAALNTELLELKLKIEEMELKEKNYERDQT
jgi:hypothetical protein